MFIDAWKTSIRNCLYNEARTLINYFLNRKIAKIQI